VDFSIVSQLTMMPRAVARKPRSPEKLENAYCTANMQHISVLDWAL
jgi:hypothetical protein